MSNLSSLDRAMRTAKGTWYFYARRSRAWFGDDDEKRRCWLLVFLRGKHRAETVLCDGPSLGERAAVHGPLQVPSPSP